MNNYEKIKAIINSGHLALTQNKEGYYYIFSTIVSDGEIRSSYGQKTIQLCMDTLGVMSFSENWINRKDLKIIKPLPYRLPVFKAGDLVEILDVGIEYLGTKRDKMMGRGPFEIKDAYSCSCIVYTEDKSDYWSFDNRSLCLYTGETKIETITIGGIEYNKADFEKAVKDLKPIS